MAIDNVGWPIRPNPVHNDGKRRQQPKRKLSKPRPMPSGTGRRRGSIDELA